MKKAALPFLLGVVLTLICIGFLTPLWWSGFMSPANNARCLPLHYPEYPFDSLNYQGTIEPYIPHIFRTETDLTPIKDFYDENLLRNLNVEDEQGSWQRSEVRPGEYLYQCHAVLNREEMERGCVYLRERDGNTIVERIWLYSATAAPMCEGYMSELPPS